MQEKQSSLTYTGYRLIILALLCGLSSLSVSANITLARFEATPQADGSILVVWETATEFNTAGFDLYRATAPLAINASWGTPIHREPTAGDGFTGATYQYRDTNVVPGVRYYYLLEELTAGGPGQRAGPVNAGIGLEPEATPTATATPTASATATRTATAPPTATATRTATMTTQPSADGSQPAPTATRQFTNTPVPPPTATPDPGAAWTPAPQPTATPVPVGQVTTPTPSGGGAFVLAPTEAPTPGETALPTPMPPPTVMEPAPLATASPPEPMSTRAMVPEATNTPQVFAQAAATSVLQNMATRPAATPLPAPPEGARNTRLTLLLGVGAMAVAGLLAIAGLLIWRASRLR